MADQVLVQAPPAWGHSVVSGPSGKSYTLNSNGQALVDSQDATALVGNGFNVLSASNTDVITTPTYTVSAHDNGRIKEFSIACTVTFPASIWSAQFGVTLLQGGSGVVSPVDDNGAAIPNRQSHTGTAGQDAIAAVIAKPSVVGQFRFGGDTA